MKQRLLSAPRELKKKPLIGDGLCPPRGADDQCARGPKDVRCVCGLEDPHDNYVHALQFANSGEVRRKRVYLESQELADVRLWFSLSRQSKTDCFSIVCHTKKQPAAEAVSEGSDSAADAGTRNRLLPLDEQILPVSWELFESGLVEIAQT